MACFGFTKFKKIEIPLHLGHYPGFFVITIYNINFFWLQSQLMEGGLE